MSKFNWAGLGIAVLTGILAAGGPALLANNSKAAGVGALLGGLTGGLSFAQNPAAAPTSFSLASVGQQLVNQEIASLVNHNTSSLGALAPVAEQLATNVVDSALTVPGTNAPAAPAPTRSAIPMVVPKPAPPAAPVIPPAPALTKLQVLQAQQAALQEAIDAEQAASAPAEVAAPATVGVPTL